MSAPLVIGRVPGEEPQSRQRHSTADGGGVGSTNGFSSTPGGNHLFGTTPGGSRIVYSREQLLSLASSPLSQSHSSAVRVPDEISRSPEKQASPTSPSSQDSGAAAAAYIAQPSTSPSTRASAAATTPRSYGRTAATTGVSHSNGIGIGIGIGRSPPASAGISTSPVARSPGNAFNFARGPFGSGGGSIGFEGAGAAAAAGNGGNAAALTTSSTAFKERLAAASAAAREQQRHLAGAHAAQAGGCAAGKEGDVQFEMEM